MWLVLVALFTADREDKWREFRGGCVERPGRWHRDLKVREVFGAPSAAETEQRLNHCAERHADCPERVSKPDVPRGFTMYADLASPATTATVRCGPEAG
ncbi:Chromate resistance protein ChrB [Amycolatopsis echigonensis]|uniref:Chromate resistance protein ChrB n=1 Tax=Amycolatopsis echigonensis TaxID=2576905 RepID=UPI0026A9F7A3